MIPQRVPRRTPTQTASIGAIAALVRARRPALGATRLVLVDGPAGSGKTTLAGMLAGALANAPVSGADPLEVDTPAQLLHADDMYEGWGGLPGLGQTLIDQVLTPLSAGREGRFHAWDWHRGLRGDEVIVPPRPVLVVEGVGVAMRGAREFASAVVWVEADPAERLRRGLERDGEQTRREWLRWQRTEQEHFVREATRAAADIHVDGDRPFGS